MTAERCTERPGRCPSPGWGARPHHVLGRCLPDLLPGAFGADIVKVESIQRPDGHRYSGAFAYEGDDWYERSPIWQGTNLNKRDLTLDLTSPRGLDLARRLAARADIVVENFSPRVVENFGLDYDSLTALNPDVIVVRMPGYGLHGPWRDYVGWALNFEQTAGMSAVTGFPDGPPCNPRARPIRSSACTPGSRCWPRSSTATAPAPANSSRWPRSRSPLRSPPNR